MTNDHMWVKADAGSADAYAQLVEPFASTHQRNGGGGTFTYITGEQCASRLNETLGYAGWSFTIIEHGINPEADEAWCRGRLTIIAPDMPGGIAVREQFGSQKIKRARSTGIPMDIGFDLKGAATDALKRCAVGIGVALYLYERESEVKGKQDDYQVQVQPQRPTAPVQQRQNNEPIPALYSAEDEALEDYAKQKHTPADIGYFAMVGQVRQATTREKLIRVRETVVADIEHRPNRAEVWTEPRKVAIRHLLTDCAAKLGFKWSEVNAAATDASQTRTAPNPGPQGQGRPEGTSQAGAA